MKQQRKMKPIADRFWEKVNKDAPNGCWEWTSSIRGSGYGAFFTHLVSEGRKAYGAHRYSWILTNGNIPDGLSVLHKCDNRICVNPSHLFLGNKFDNMRDAANKKRISTVGKSRMTHCLKGHEYTPDNVKINNQGHRRCKMCADIFDAKRGRKSAAIRARGAP